MHKIRSTWLTVGVVILSAATVLACAPAPAPTAAPKAADKAAAPAPATKPAILSTNPNAPPRPPAATAVPGTTPPPAPVPPAPKTVPLYAYIDTTTAGNGESKYNVDANLSCVKTSAFARGMHIVWRMEVVDTSTGKILQGTDVDEAVLKLPHGEEVKMRYGRHGSTADAPWFWTAAWSIPLDYPLGALDYGVTVKTKDGKSIVVRDPLRVSAPDRGIESALMIVAVQ